MSLHYAVIGSGAIGGYLGAKLQQAGLSVSFVARSNYKVLKQRGFSIEEAAGISELSELDVYPTIDQLPPVDVLLVACKTTSNATVLPQLAKHLATNGVVVLLQNGIGYEQMMAEYINADQIIAAAVTIKTTQIKPAYIKHYGFSKISLACYSNTDNQQHRLSEIANDIRKTGIDTHTQDSCTTIRWRKLCHNIPFNGLSVVLNTDNRGLCTSSASVALIQELTTEVVNVAKHCGAALSLSDELQKADKVISNIRSNSNAGSPSMKDDYDNGRELELDAIYKNPLAIAKQHQVAMPLTTMLYQQLCFIEKDD